MNCNFCQNVIPEGTLECPICGKRVITEEEALARIRNVEHTVASAETTGTAAAAAPTKKRRKKKKSLTTSFISLIIGVVAWVYGFLSDTVNTIFQELKFAFTSETMADKSIIEKITGIEMPILIMSVMLIVAGILGIWGLISWLKKAAYNAKI
ncbi:MAG: hypothetical protein LBL82_05495 [Oscillospiraceae bacterium]|jgi:uncharacterized Zn finger protein (UPF0148 family)|nr:hypothetical protein [Oscillospiraceae bacterium]